MTELVVVEDGTEGSGMLTNMTMTMTDLEKLLILPIIVAGLLDCG